MASITTAMCTSFKGDLLEGIHQLQGTITATGTVTSSSKNITSLSSIANLSAGLLVTDSGSNIPAGTYTSKLISTTSVGMDTAATGSGSVTVTFKGDQVAFALIKQGYVGTYGAASTNYSDITSNSDEASGAGYTTGGYVWAAGAMITPATSGTGAYTQPSTNPSWTNATLDVQGGMLYNYTKLGKGIAVESFGGEQKVTGGTLTLLLPTNGVGTSLLQIN